jgi:hypothetical protein
MSKPSARNSARRKMKLAELKKLLSSNNYVDRRNGYSYLDEFFAGRGMSADYPVRNISFVK